MMHGRFHPDEIIAATRMRVITVSRPEPTEPVPARHRPHVVTPKTRRHAHWQRRHRLRRPALRLDAA